MAASWNPCSWGPRAAPLFLLDLLCLCLAAPLKPAWPVGMGTPPYPSGWDAVDSRPDAGRQRNKSVKQAFRPPFLSCSEGKIMHDVARGNSELWNSESSSSLHLSPAVSTVAHCSPELPCLWIKIWVQPKVMKQEHKSLTHQPVQAIDAIHLPEHHEALNLDRAALSPGCPSLHIVRIVSVLMLAGGLRPPEPHCLVAWPLGPFFS